MSLSRHAPLLALSLLASAAPAFAGCHSRSSVGEHETIAVRGTVLTQSGAPDRGATVSLYDNDLFDVFVFCFLTAVLPIEQASTSATGSYALTISGSLANGLFGARPFVIGLDDIFTHNPDDPTVGVEFYAMQTRVDVPPMQLWDGHGVATLQGDEAVFAFDDLCVRTGTAPSSYEVELEQQGGLRYQSLTSAAQPTVRLPALALQDLSWRWRPIAYAEIPGSGTTFRMTYRGRPQSIHGANAAPPSRGRLVSATTGGTHYTELTDGDLATGLPQGIQGPVRLELDLGAPLPLSALFCYGLSARDAYGSASVNVSVHDRPGMAAASPVSFQVSAMIQEVPLPAGTYGRYVVIETAGDIDGLDELAIY